MAAGFMILRYRPDSNNCFGYYLHSPTNDHWFSALGTRLNLHLFSNLNFAASIGQHRGCLCDLKVSKAFLQKNLKHVQQIPAHYAKAKSLLESKKWKKGLPKASTAAEMTAWKEATHDISSLWKDLKSMPFINSPADIIMPLCTVPVWQILWGYGTVQHSQLSSR